MGHFARECASPPGDNSKSFECWKCRGRGHWAKNCASRNYYNLNSVKNNNNENKNNNNNNNNEQKVDKLCYNCDSPDHIQRQCPDPQKNDICYKCNETGHWARQCKNPRSYKPRNYSNGNYNNRNNNNRNYNNRNHKQIIHTVYDQGKQYNFHGQGWNYADIKASIFKDKRSNSFLIGNNNNTNNNNINNNLHSNIIIPLNMKIPLQCTGITNSMMKMISFPQDIMNKWDEVEPMLIRYREIISEPGQLTHPLTKTALRKLYIFNMNNTKEFKDYIKYTRGGRCDVLILGVLVICECPGIARCIHIYIKIKRTKMLKIKRHIMCS